MNREQRRAATPHGKPMSRPAAPAVQAVFAAAVRYHQAGRGTDAERLYRQILTIDPRHAGALHLLGVIAQEQGRHDLAVELIGQAIAINPADASSHSNLGTALWKLGKLDLAVTCYRRAIELKPDYPKAWFNLATVLWKQGKWEEAEAGYRRALQNLPSYPEAYDNLGSMLRERGRLDEAIENYRRAIAVRPDYPEAHNNLGTAILDQGRPEEAIVCYRTALDLRPDYPEARLNLGNAVWELRGRPDDAVPCYLDAIASRPNYADAHLNLGTALKELGRLDEAVACYRRVLTLDPDHPEGHSNLGIALLARGELEEGWREHEWRWRTPQVIGARREFPQPQWRGEPAVGRTLLIHAEQGFGDTLQFCRYAPLAAARGSRVILEVQPPLVRLLRGLPGVDQIVGRGEALPDFDLQCPMLSLPMAFGTTLPTIPSAERYLHADAARVAVWRTRLATTSGQGSHRRPQIGLVWAGNPRDHSRALTAVDRRRSMSLEQFAPLFELPGARFFSLQKDTPTPPKGADREFPLIDFMGEMDDFADTAALIVNLDLVIAVDTAVAHLAAALGTPVWLLDRFDSCWRWFAGRRDGPRRDSPWYPGMRLYRQRHPGDWDSVVKEVVSDLQGHFVV